MGGKGGRKRGKGSYLRNHVVEGRDDTIDGDGLESQTENAIEFGKHESESRLLGGLGEGLSSYLEASDVHDIL